MKDKAEGASAYTDIPNSAPFHITDSLCISMVTYQTSRHLLSHPFSPPWSLHPPLVGPMSVWASTFGGAIILHPEHISSSVREIKPPVVLLPCADASAYFSSSLMVRSRNNHGTTGGHGRLHHTWKRRAYTRSFGAFQNRFPENL